MTPTDLRDAIHDWNERNRDAGCVHFDKGYGPYALCEDPEEGVPIRALSEIIAASSLDAAWAEAEAALPPDAVIRMGRSGGGQTRGWATAYLHGECIGVEFADTLPAALRALTAKLRANR